MPAPRNFWTSDTHKGHANVIRYCDRPWAIRRKGSRDFCRPSQILGVPVNSVPYERLKSDVMVDVDEMDAILIERHNSVVGKDDIVYHLGDVAFCKRHQLPEYLEQLNGYKILVGGNHDRSNAVMKEAGFDEVYGEITLDVDHETMGGLRIYMHHQPRLPKYWPVGTTHHFCGHVHEKWRRKGNMINVGVDQWDFTPRTLEELLAAPEQGDLPTPEEME